MKKSLFVMAALCAGAAMTGCAGSKKAVESVNLNGEWNIVEVEGKKLTAEELPFIGLETAEKRVYGNAGCNRIIGTYEADSLKPGFIHFNQLGTTRMMCPDMETERVVTEALNKVAGYTGTEAGVALTDAEGKELVILQKREQKALSLADLAGEWKIATVDGAEVVVGKEDKVPFLAFDTAEMRVHGNAGCNLINGGFSQEEGQPASLRFSQMISTMMAGPNMELEGKILKAIDQVRSFAAGENGVIILQDAEGNAVLTLVKNTEGKLSE